MTAGRPCAPTGAIDARAAPAPRAAAATHALPPPHASRRRPPMPAGASGYIGSLVLEQLLRTTDVSKVFVLIRGKRGCPAPERLRRLLQSGLFHLVRDRPDLLAKVELLEGNMASDDLGLAPGDVAKLVGAVNFVIHSAASIELEADVQHTLRRCGLGGRVQRAVHRRVRRRARAAVAARSTQRTRAALTAAPSLPPHRAAARRSNYIGTRRLLALAGAMGALRCFLHVSSAYVNVNLPKGSSVDEAIYPLHIGTQAAHHGAVVDDLMSLAPSAANVRVRAHAAGAPAPAPAAATDCTGWLRSLTHCRRRTPLAACCVLLACTPAHAILLLLLLCRMRACHAMCAVRRPRCTWTCGASQTPTRWARTSQRRWWQSTTRAACPSPSCGPALCAASPARRECPRWQRTACGHLAPSAP